MKKLAFLLWVIMTLTNVIHSQQIMFIPTPGAEGEYRDKLRGAVKSYTETTYKSYDKKDASSYYEIKFEKIISYKFDDKGKRLSRTTRNDSVIYIYDNKGNVINKEGFWHGKLIESGTINKFTYDNNGNVIEYIETDKDNGKLNNHEKTKYIFDNKGNIIECLYFHLNMRDTSLMLWMKTLSKYDDKGNQIELKSYFGNDGRLWIWENNVYEYDQYGNWTTKKIFSLDDNGNRRSNDFILKIREYEYYPENSSINNDEEPRIVTNDVFIICEQKNEKPMVDIKGKKYYYVVRQNIFEVYSGKTFSDAVAAGMMLNESVPFTIIENGIIIEGKMRNVQLNFDENGNLNGKKIMGAGIMYKRTNEKFIPKIENQVPTASGKDFRGGQFKIQMGTNAFVVVDERGEPIDVHGQFMYIYLHGDFTNQIRTDKNVLFFMGSSWHQALKNGIQKDGSIWAINEYENCILYKWNKVNRELGDFGEEPLIRLEWAGNGIFKGSLCRPDCLYLKQLTLKQDNAMRVKDYVILYNIK